MSAEDNSDHENGFAMFTERDSINEAIIFESISIDHEHKVWSEEKQEYDERGTLITFEYSYCHETFFHSKLFLPNIQSFPLTFTTWRMAVYSIGMCVLPWYWMGFATKKIILSNELLDFIYPSKENLQYWDTFYKNNLAEFIYENDLSFNSITIELANKSTHNKSNIAPALSNIEKTNKDDTIVIVPLGGGKDSLVVWQMMQDANENVLLVYVADGFREYESHRRLPKIVSLTGSSLQLVKHDFVYDSIGDHAKSYCIPCGHPWAALVMFDNVLIAGIQGIPRISVGYEKSADEGNGVFVGDLEVNHQYDKSSPFVALSNEYIHTFISKDILVESKLSSMWEIEIMKLFCTKLPHFHPLFISCNSPIDDGSEWCLECEKCAFIYLLLAAYLPVSYITDRIFPRRDKMLSNPYLTDLFQSLVGQCSHDGKKPFDCIGTKEEIELAVKMCIWQHYQSYCNAAKSMAEEQDGDSGSTFLDEIDLKQEAMRCIPGNLQGLARTLSCNIPKIFCCTTIDELVQQESQWTTKE